MNEVTLESLVGERDLSGVDMLSNTEEFGDASVCVFEIDGKVYTAAEDPINGYRSYLGMLREGGEIKNAFSPQRVLCLMAGDNDDILVMRDMLTGKDVLAIGTSNSDYYYPSFVANFQPEHMACNQVKSG